VSDLENLTQGLIKMQRPHVGVDTGCAGCQHEMFKYKSKIIIYIIYILLEPLLSYCIQCVRDNWIHSVTLLHTLISTLYIF